MRGALFLMVPLAIGCSSDSACVLDSDCADFTMVCVARQCVPVGADGGRRDGGPTGDDDAGSTETPDAGSVETDAGTDASTTPDAGPPCADVTGAWTVTPSDPATCSGGMATFSVSVERGASTCEFVMGAPLDGTFTVAMDGALSGTVRVADASVECAGNAADAITMTCGACQFTLTR